MTLRLAHRSCLLLLLLAAPCFLRSQTAQTVRATLAEQRALFAARPHDPAPAINLAYVLTDAGAGDLARVIARQAIAAAPNSAFASSAAGWVLHHNSLGVDYGRGSSFAESFTALRKSIELDPNDLNVRQSLANGFEYNDNGIRYAPGAHLSEAIDVYRYVKSHQKTPDPQVEHNLLIDLFYAGQYEAAAQEAAVAPPSPIQEGVAIAALAASQGLAAAIVRANAMAADPERRTAALKFASEGLTNMRLYPQAAALLQAGLGDEPAPATTLARIRVLSSLQPYRPAPLAASDPRSPVRSLLTGVIAGTLTQSQASALLIGVARLEGEQWRRILAMGFPQNLQTQTGLSPDALQDLALGNLRLTVEPGPGGGSRVSAQFFALPPAEFLVLSEQGQAKIAAGTGDFAAAGAEVVALLRQGHDAEARALLDWERSQANAVNKDDPLGGPLVPRFWTGNPHPDPADMELAAFSLAPYSEAAAASLPRLLGRRDRTPDGPARTDLDLLLATVSVAAQDGKQAAPLTDALLRRYPHSLTALRLAGRACAIRKDWTGWNALLNGRLAQEPGNRDLLLEKAFAQQAQGQFAQARATLQTILDSGRALPSDSNAYAWLNLFTNTVDSQALDAAQHATLDGKPDFATLHTLACIYAVLGRTEEARQTLLAAMAAANLVEPDGAIWCGFGLIYEQIGESDAAVQAFNRVEKPTGALDPVSTYALAQAHLLRLTQSASPSPDAAVVLPESSRDFIPSRFRNRFRAISKE